MGGIDWFFVQSAFRHPIKKSRLLDHMRAHPFLLFQNPRSGEWHDSAEMESPQLLPLSTNHSENTAIVVLDNVSTKAARKTQCAQYPPSSFENCIWFEKCY